MNDYRTAIVEARDLIENAIDEELDEDCKAELIRAKPALFGDAERYWSDR